MKFWRLTILVLLVALTGCVGTIEDTKLKTTKSTQKLPPPISFTGIENAIPISHDKVEVFFFPAVGDAKDLIYSINYDGLTTPITVPGESLEPDYRGLLKAKVTGLSTNSPYNFEVQVKNIKTKQESFTTTTRSAITYSNITANFMGISAVKNMPGLAGVNSILVEWPEAEKQGSAFVPKDIDVVEYVIVVVNADLGNNPGSINDPGVKEPDKLEWRVGPTQKTAVVNGLQPDTEYHVQVRAKHHGFTLFGSDINYKVETNTDYMTIKTLSADLSSISFDASTFEVNLAPGAAGLNSLDLIWVAAQGAFDHYRIYYGPSGNSVASIILNKDIACSGTETFNINIFCKQVDFLTIITQLTDLIANTEYEVMLVICQNDICSNNISTPVVKKTTTPPVANFQGVIDVLGAKDLAGITQLHLEVIPPDLTSGVIDGILVEFQGIPAGSPVYLNHPIAPNTSALSLLSFDFKNATEIAVDGVDPFETNQYCFRAFPYTLDGGVPTEFPNNIIKCKVPEINAPTIEEFDGISGNCDVNGNTITVTWNPPSNGIFSSFEIFYRDNLGAFSFNDATLNTPPLGGSDYTRATTPDSATEISIGPLPSGTYQVGVLSYIFINGTHQRSDFNTNIVQCVIP